MTETVTPVAEEAPAADKPRGFTGWFPFAARRPKPALPEAESVETSDTPADELPRELFGAVEDEPSASEDAEGSEEGAESDEEAKPKRRRRRGGRRRRKKTSDATSENGVDEKAEEADDQLTESVESQDKSEDDSESEDGEAKPKRRRRRRGGRRKSTKDDATTSETESDVPSEDAASIEDEEEEHEEQGGKSAAPSHKNITPWQEAIGVVVDANIAARDESATQESVARSQRPKRSSGRGGRSRGRSQKDLVERALRAAGLRRGPKRAAFFNSG